MPLARDESSGLNGLVNRMGSYFSAAAGWGLTLSTCLTGPLGCSHPPAPALGAAAAYPGSLAAAQRSRVRQLAIGGNTVAALKEAEILRGMLAPGDPAGWIEAGHIYELERQFSLALAQYDQAAAVAPKLPDGPREGGLRAAHWGELELARPRLEEALRRDPSAADLWHALGLVCLQLGDQAGARRSYLAGLLAEPSSFANHLGLATLAWMVNDAALALREYDAMARLRPRLADVQLGRAWALISLGQTELAEKALVRAERLGARAEFVARQRLHLQSLR